MAGFSTLVTTLLAFLHLPTTVRFVDQACENVASLLPEYVVGQDLALEIITAAICEHVRPNYTPPKPLVLSVHGPPGVGKTFTHTLLAKALYNKDPYAAKHCPGEHCQGAKVIYGLDFMQHERDQQLSAVRAAILDHVHHTPDPLIVIEEYDKLDCESRGMLRQIIAHPELANTTGRAIIMLESNLGFSELEQMLTEAHDRASITFEAAVSRLKALVFDTWRRSEECESYADTLSFTAMVNFYVPFFPLQRDQVVELTDRQLKDYRARMLAEHPGVVMTWQPGVVKWLADKVELVDGYPLEGANAVQTVCRFYAAHAFLAIPRQLEQARREQCAAAGRSIQQCSAGQGARARDGSARVMPVTYELVVGAPGKGGQQRLEAVQRD